MNDHRVTIVSRSIFLFLNTAGSIRSLSKPSRLHHTPSNMKPIELNHEATADNPLRYQVCCLFLLPTCAEYPVLMAVTLLLEPHELHVTKYNLFSPLLSSVSGDLQVLHETYSPMIVISTQLAIGFRMPADFH